MSRFRPDERKNTPEEPLPLPPPQPSVNLVPISAEEFDRQKRQKYIKWGSAGAIVALLILAFLYRSSMPAAALNHYIDATKLYDSGKYTDALQAASAAARDKGQRLSAYRLRAGIYRALHQPKNALDDVSRVIEMQPDSADDYQFRAQTYLDLDDPTNAAKDYSRLIELKNSGDAYNGRGLCYLKLNQTQKAIDDFTRAIDRDPRVEFYLQRGLAWGTLGDHRKAIDDLNQAIELRPELSTTYRARANEEQELGDAAGAEKDRDKATSLEKPTLPPPSQVVLPKTL
jgi:tetratricopeptide (TPR) repeat protein